MTTVRRHFPDPTKLEVWNAVKPRVRADASHQTPQSSGGIDATTATPACPVALTLGDIWAQRAKGAHP